MVKDISIEFSPLGKHNRSIIVEIVSIIWNFSEHCLIA